MMIRMVNKILMQGCFISIFLLPERLSATEAEAFPHSLNLTDLFLPQNYIFFSC